MTEETKAEILQDLNEIYGEIWGVDIPSPTVPEYIEHHNEMQMLMKIVAEKIGKWEAKDYDKPTKSNG